MNELQARSDNRSRIYWRRCDNSCTYKFQHRYIYKVVCYDGFGFVVSANDVKEMEILTNRSHSFERVKDHLDRYGAVI